MKFLCISLAECPVFEQWHGFERGGERRKLGAHRANEQMRDTQVAGTTKLI